MSTSDIPNDNANGSQCIALIVRCPTICWLDFLRDFIQYDVYVIIDDETKNYNDIYAKDYPNIKFIQVSSVDCLNSGFVDTNFAINKLISGWDKALYYFALTNTSYDKVWFIEDDVFFYKEITIVNIDKKYKDADLLSKEVIENNEQNNKEWYWECININHSPPYYHGMMCAVRMSRRLLSCIKEYATNNKSLYFLEALFPTICSKHGLKGRSIEELKNIYYRHTFEFNNLNKDELFHPVKVIEDHVTFRSLM
jgi:hypothetical protein